MGLGFWSPGDCWCIARHLVGETPRVRVRLRVRVRARDRVRVRVRVRVRA